MTLIEKFRVVSSSLPIRLVKLASSVSIFRAVPIHFDTGFRPSMTENAFANTRSAGVAFQQNDIEE